MNQDFLGLLAHTPDFIYFKDRHSRLRFCSQAMASFCGYEDWREMIGKHDSELFAVQIARAYFEGEGAMFEEGKPLLNKVDPYFDHEGSQRWVSTNKWPVFGDDGKTVVGIFGVSRDITPTRRAEEEAQHHALRYETLLRSASDGIHVLDSKGNVREANDAFCRMLGYSHEEALTMNVSEWDARWSPAQLRDEIIPGLLARTEVFETKHRRRDGQLIDVEVSCSAVELDGERVLFAASRDISERKRSEEKIRRFAAEMSEANRKLIEANNLKEVFTDVLRHDLLSPINAIQFSTELLVERESDPAKLALLTRLRRSTANLLEMIENAAKLASLTGGQSLEYRTADPVQVMRSVLPDLEHKLLEKHITLTDRSEGGFSASFNPMMSDVFGNLVSNAIKYSPAGTEVELTVEERGEWWVFSVKDQGAGVPDPYKLKIFNRFERLRKEGVKGSGLGLTISRQIVRLHGGEIWVEDNAPAGSIFRVKVPKLPTPVLAPPA